MLGWALALLALGGCDRVLGLEAVPNATDAGDASDARRPGLDAFACGPSSIAPGDFSTPVLMFTNATSPSLTGDQQLMYVAVSGTLQYSTDGNGWTALMPVDSLNDGSDYDDRPSLSYDGLHIFFTRHPASGGYDLPYEAIRTDDVTQTWSPVTSVVFPPVLAGNDVTFGIPSADGRLVDVSHGVDSHYHLTELALDATHTWTLTDNTTALYHPGDNVSDTNAQLSPDGCWMVFSRIDHDVEPGHEIMLAARGLDGTFGAPVLLLTNNSTQDEQHPWLSPDGNTLYYFDGVDGSVYVATRGL